MNDLLVYLPLLAQGAMLTLAAWLCAGAIGLTLGIGIGIATCRQLSITPIIIVAKLYVFIAKGIPAYIQILIAYFVLPLLLPFKLPAFAAAVGALGFCSSGYVAEIIRAGINSVPEGQWHAAYVLGYPLGATLKKVVMPQAFRNALPALFGEFEQLLKSTSLLATIGITELTRTGMNIISRELNPLLIYCTVASVYLLFSGILQLVNIYLERRMHHAQR